MIKDLVSIVVPTYNDAHYLEDFFSDLLNQTYTLFEVLIVNDGSTDNTEEIAKKYCEKDSRFKLFTKKNGGTGSALNLGFSKAQGEFGTWISSDDRKEPTMVEDLVSFLKNNRDIEFVTSAFHSDYVNRDLRAFIPDDLNYKGYRRGYFGTESENCTNKSLKVDEWIDINYEQCYQGINFMFTMNLKNKCGDYLEIPGEDYYMTAKMGLVSRVGYIDKVLGTHKDPPDALSNIDRSCVAEANVLTRKLILEKHVPWELKNIPKIAHFYWGSDKMSYLRFMTIKSFKLLNPDWSVYLYVPKNVTKEITWDDDFHRSDSTDYKGSDDFFPEIKKMPVKIISCNFPNHVNNLGEAQKSDYLRWRVLYQDGGFWCDMDIVHTKPLNKIYFNKGSFANLDCTVSYSEVYGHQIGFFFTRPKNPLFKELVVSSGLKQANKYQDLGCYLLNNIGPTKEINEKFDIFVLNVNQRVFYHLDHTKIDKIFEFDSFDQLPEETIGIHWYGGSEMAQKYNNLLKKNTLKDYNNTITQAILSLENL